MGCLALGRARSGDVVDVTAAEAAAFRDRGLVVLENVLTEDEVRSIEAHFDDVVDNRVPGLQAEMANDFTDMSQPFSTPFQDWRIVNAMLPHKYHPPLRNNVWERVALRLARQIYPDADLVQDYDQLLDKRPGQERAVFSWHQDMAYWPPAALTANDTRTVTATLAIDDETPENGCLKFLPESNKAKALRPHRPLVAGGRSEAHAVVANVDEATEVFEFAPVKRGGVTLHDEWVVHGSSGNAHPTFRRRTYVIAYRSSKIVAAERAAGFTHSHNDVANWDTFNPSIVAPNAEL